MASVSSNRVPAPPTSAAPSPRRRLDTFGALQRHPNFRLYWGGALCSNIGTWMQNLAQSWLVYQLTGSALLLGTVSFLQAVPSLFLSLLGGVLADRVERRSLMLVTQLAAMILAFVLAGLTLAHVVTVIDIMIIALLSGLVNAINTPVRQGIISDLVPRADLQNAIAVSSAQFQTSRLVGPALAGLVVAAFGAGWAFFVNGLSFLAVIVSLLLLKLPPWTPPSKKESVFQSASAGVTFVFRHDVLGTLVLIAAVPALFALPYQSMMPVFAKTVLHVGPQGLGVLLSATGAGALVGALIVASLSSFRRRGLLQLGSGMVFGLMLLAFSFSRQIQLSVALLVVGSAFSMMFSSINQTFLQTLAPDAMRGRVLSVLTLTTFGVMPLGSMLAGVVAQGWGAPLAVGVGGAVTALFALAVLALRPVVRRLE
ncbi:MAG TPA: MFS transporter [Chloroflexota bacterium]|jgi:MFS family permease|nr:MFS transporter [Chloroflexota bacterium]